MRKLCVVLGLFLFFIALSLAFVEEDHSQCKGLDKIDLLGFQIWNIPQIAPKPTNGDDIQRIMIIFYWYISAAYALRILPFEGRE